MMNKEKILYVDNDVADGLNFHQEESASYEPEVNCDRVAEIDVVVPEEDIPNLDYRLFVTKITDMVRERMGDGYTIRSNKIFKNNSVELDSISIQKDGQNIAPIYYLNMFYPAYQGGESSEHIVEQIISSYHESMCNMEDFVGIPLTYEHMKDKIIFRVINYDMNKEMLEQMPHYRYLDLAVTFCCLLRIDGQGMGTVKIDNTQMESWQIDREELYRVAKENSPRLLPCAFDNIFKVLANLMLREMNESVDIDKELFAKIIENLLRSEEERYANAMYVLTTESGINGASCIFYEGVLESLYTSFGCGFYILPSSVNELILIPDTCAGIGEKSHLAELVHGVNSSEVPRQEILSDRAYHYPEDNFKIAV